MRAEDPSDGGKVLTSDEPVAVTADTCYEYSMDAWFTGVHGVVLPIHSLLVNTMFYHKKKRVLSSSLY